MNLDFVGEKEC